MILCWIFLRPEAILAKDGPTEHLDPMIEIWDWWARQVDHCPRDELAKIIFISYKYNIKLSEQVFTIFILYCIYIFKASLSQILSDFYLSKRYLFKQSESPHLH